MQPKRQKVAGGPQKNSGQSAWKPEAQMRDGEISGGGYRGDFPSHGPKISEIAGSGKKNGHRGPVVFRLAGANSPWQSKLI
jgi:hypothetical protein